MKNLFRIIAVVAVLLAPAFATSVAFARDKADWFDVQVTGVDSNKIGERHTSSRWSRHHDSVAIEGHMVTVHANGKIFEVSSPKEMVEPGPYRAMLVNKGRDMRIRYEDNGRREDATFRIDSVSPDAPAPAPVSAEKTKLEWEDMTKQKDAQADPSKFVISPDPKSHLGVCIQVLTQRDGSQTCMAWADHQPGK